MTAESHRNDGIVELSQTILEEGSPCTKLGDFPRSVANTLFSKNHSAQLNVLSVMLQP